MKVYEISFVCPDIQSQADAEIVREIIINSPGVGDVTIDLATKVVTVVTANQDAGLDVRHRLFDSGFPPDE